jgi:hypothetical protein
MRIENVKKTDVKNTPDKNKNSALFYRKRSGKARNETFKQILKKEMNK